MRRALSSVAVAFAGAAAVILSGWALQAAALPPPTPATRVAADASAWLHDYRLVVDVFHVHHRRFEGACLRGWFAGPHEPKARASLLSLDSGRLIRIPARRHALLATGNEGRLPQRILALVGCSGQIATVLAAAAQSGDGHLTTERSYAANRPAVALELNGIRSARLTLYVSPRTFRPLVAFVDARGHVATARLYLARARPSLLRRFHLPREARR